MPPNPNFCFTQVPFAMGTAGLLLGLAALAVLTTASACGAHMLLEIYLAHPWAQNLPELGEAAMVRTDRRHGGFGWWWWHWPVRIHTVIDRLTCSTHKHNQTLQGRLGKRLAATCQLLNFVGFLPVALFIAGGALQVRSTGVCVMLSSRF